MPSLISLPVNFCSVIMASRRSSDGTPDSNSQIVKNEPASPINTVNRFTILGTIPKPNYSSVLASTYDPYVLTNIHRPVQTIFPRNPNASQYVKKRYVQNLFSVEPNRASITNPFKLATSYFPPLFHRIPEHRQKNVQYYSAILQHEHSITIKPIRDKANGEKIIYQISLFPTLIMIILLPGSDSCSTKMKQCPIHGLSIFIKTLTLFSPSGSSDGGLSLVQLLKYFLHH